MSTAEAPAAVLHPPAPILLEETGLTHDLVTDLVRKVLWGSSGLSGSELSRQVGLAFSAIEPALDFLKAQRQCEIVSGSILGGGSFRYRLTQSGLARAKASLKQSQYVGTAPVPMDQYRGYMETFRSSVSQPVSPEEVRAAFADLVISDSLLDEIGPAVNAQHSIFIYGPPGNGKTVMARAIRGMLAGVIAVPRALEVGGNIIRFFDPSVHEPVQRLETDPYGVKYDQRWVLCRRPMVSVGGELTLESLSLAFDPRTGVYRAPVQALANGGVLVIDDFGRQQCPPRDLLNWWMVPLESRVEYMALRSGEKVQMPFEALLIFSTNIRPSDLVDEAFLRRIQYKIYAGSPTREQFIEIFERCCASQRIAFDRSLVENLLDHMYRPRGIELRACHPRDLINQALAFASYSGQPRGLTPELLEASCVSYFITGDREASGTPA